VAIHCLYTRRENFEGADLTTIAWRDGVLAADTLVTSNSIRDGHQQKIHRVGPVLVGGVGYCGTYELFRTWVRGGMKGDSPYQGRDDGHGFLASRCAVLCFGGSGPRHVRGPFSAHGSGWEIAMGAMAMGANAEQAVRTAIEWDTGSGGEVTVLKLESR
jgi:20S proteasome alpha/beta subunit